MLAWGYTKLDEVPCFIFSTGERLGYFWIREHGLKKIWNPVIRVEGLVFCCCVETPQNLCAQRWSSAHHHSEVSSGWWSVVVVASAVVGMDCSLAHKCTTQTCCLRFLAALWLELSMWGWAALIPIKSTLIAFQHTAAHVSVISTHTSDVVQTLVCTKTCIFPLAGCLIKQ